MAVEKIVPATKMWETEHGPIIVLECTCGLAVDYPGHPDARHAVTCEHCGTIWKLKP